MLNGGLAPHRPYLLIGPGGTGKTTLALQFLCEGVRRGEETLLVTLEEPPNECRFNHRNLLPELDKVWVFDAIPDVMRYERTPFKDVAQVRESLRFQDVSPDIRKTPELQSVEVTLTALEQMIRMEVARRKYRRLVIDSLTALQLFCMKGLDEVVGAQSLLRFLTGLGLTTLLTVESPLEDADTPERMLARGEIRFFRWELESRTVRALGVEKLRGSAHDIRLHPYRIGRAGLDVNIEDTISQDTRRIVSKGASLALEEHEAPIVVTVHAPEIDPIPAMVERLLDEIVVLHEAKLDLGPIRARLAMARAAIAGGEMQGATQALREARGLIHQMTLGLWSRRSSQPGASPNDAGPDAPPEFSDQPLTVEKARTLLAKLTETIGEAEPPGQPRAPGPSIEPPQPPAAFGFTQIPPTPSPASVPTVLVAGPEVRATPAPAAPPPSTPPPSPPAIVDSPPSPAAPVEPLATPPPAPPAPAVAPGPVSTNPESAVSAPVPSGGRAASPPPSADAGAPTITWPPPPTPAPGFGSVTAEVAAPVKPKRRTRAKAAAPVSEVAAGPPAPVTAATAGSPVPPTASVPEAAPPVATPAVAVKKRKPRAKPKPKSEAAPADSPAAPVESGTAGVAPPNVTASEGASAKAANHESGSSASESATARTEAVAEAPPKSGEVAGPP
jgi:KaiC/GvpD/RAD55 family RecA-like ATPase